MRRMLVVLVGLLALGGAGYALAAATTGTVSVCATTPAQTIKANASTVGTIPGASACKTVTYTQSTVTTTRTVTVTTAGTTTAPTTTTNPNPPSGTANLFVAPSGNDSTCVRLAAPVPFGSPSSNVCKTPRTACMLAQSGDTVILEDGTYSGAMDGCSEGHQGYAQNVVFTTEPGQACPISYPAVPTAGSDTSCPVTISNLSLSGNGAKSCGVSSGNPLPSTLAASAMATWDTHLTFQGVYAGEMYGQCAAHIDLEGVAGSDFFLRQGVYDWTINGSDFGNNKLGDVVTIGDSTSTTSYPPLQDVTLENSLVHDFVSTNGEHGDGLFIQPSYNISVVKDVFARNDCIPLYVNYAQNAQIGVHNLLVVGNVIHEGTQNNSGFGSCGQALSLGDNDQFGTLAAFNSVSTDTIGIRRSNSGSEQNSGIRIVGNVTNGIAASSSGNAYGCGSGTTADFNVLMQQSEAGCASDNILGVPLPFMSEDTVSTAGGFVLTPTLGNYQLAAGSSAIAEVPAAWCMTDAQTQQACLDVATDINGVPRPSMAHPGFYDAGAYENR